MPLSRPLCLLEEEFLLALPVLEFQMRLLGLGFQRVLLVLLLLGFPVGLLCLEFLLVLLLLGFQVGLPGLAFPMAPLRLPYLVALLVLLGRLPLSVLVCQAVVVGVLVLAFLELGLLR